MDYTVIDRATWSRREYFEHYLSAVPCTYSMTVKLDITNIRQKGLKLYPTMLYILTTAVNRHEQFRMSLNDRGELLLYAAMNPCYTVFHKETETFSNIWTSYSEDYTTFCRRYEEDCARYGNIEGFTAKPDEPENSFPVSMISENGRFYLPLAVQVHHAVCDGFHVCRLIDDVQSQINAI